MPDSLIDLGGGVKMLNPSALTSDSASAAANSLSLVNLQNQIANAPLERKRLETEVKLKENELNQIGVRNLLERAKLQKEVNDELRSASKFALDAYKQLPDLFDVDFTVGQAALQAINPNAEAIQNDDGTVTIQWPSQEMRKIEGQDQPVPTTEKLRISINPNRLTQEQKISLENEWYTRVNNSPEVKDFGEISKSYRNLKQVIEQATGQADIAAMNNFINITNPGTNLRPGQQASLEQLGGLGSAFQTMYYKAFTSNAPVFGPKGSPERKNFLNAADVLYKNAREDALSVGRNAADVAKSQGLNPRSILRPVGDLKVDNFLLTDSELLKQLTEEANK